MPDRGQNTARVEHAVGICDDAQYGLLELADVHRAYLDEDIVRLQDLVDFEYVFQALEDLDDFLLMIAIHVDADECGERHASLFWVKHYSELFDHSVIVHLVDALMHCGRSHSKFARDLRTVGTAIPGEPINDGLICAIH